MRTRRRSCAKSSRCTRTRTKGRWRSSWLNNHGIKRNLRGNTCTKTFTNSSVQRMITNPVYIEKIAHGRNSHRRTETIEGTRNLMVSSITINARMSQSDIKMFTFLLTQLATLQERATFTQRREIRQRLRNTWQTPARTMQRRERTDQTARIGMTSSTIHFLGSAVFNNLARIHNGNTISNLQQQ